ncbi:MauE/DoxX family redox-associated membrane protein [Parapedobacter indicus]|uniref:Methylamine utilisation protein MauE n=1 Tax=Parapedobacter indicus TaxID=1477437 RepID=A0A1I3IS22_9SPHI|nr:MauE/DoxX family redox-associated membrane protein [Parapedobacter indicus]PPL02271.1 methylamine utilization protein MauE [Parapedobacter indicus]SFI50719.1 Methylamine utilisation protein MauE [Parapedobacter indicus]
MKTKSIIITLVRLTLIALWGSVAVEKLWDLSGFHSILRRQPIPEWSADILFWLLPLLELGAVVLLAWPQNRTRIYQGMWLSAVLMLGFTLFILFGVLDWYEKRPCGCGSIINGLSWKEHLWFNLTFLTLSWTGIILSKKQRGGADKDGATEGGSAKRPINTTGFFLNALKSKDYENVKN